MRGSQARSRRKYKCCATLEQPRINWSTSDTVSAPAAISRMREMLVRHPDTGDHLVTMESVRDTYSRINPDSPWRWVPYPTLALAALTMAALTAYDPTTRSPKTALGLPAASAVVCWWSYVKMGSPRAVLIAREWEAES